MTTLGTKVLLYLSKYGGEESRGDRKKNLKV